MRRIFVFPQPIQEKSDAIRNYLIALWRGMQQRITLAVYRANSRSVWALVIIFLVLTAINALVFAQSMTALTDREQWVAHTQVVQTRLADFQVEMLNAETGQRGYLLTGNMRYLQPYTAALPLIDQDMRALHSLMQDNPRQQQALADIQPLVVAKLAKIQETITLRQAGNMAAALQIVNTNASYTLMAQIRQRITGMQTEEDRLLAQRQLASQQAMTDAVITFSLGLIALCIFFLLAGRFIQLYMQRKEQIALERATQMQREQKMRKLAEEALQQRDEVFGIVAHELKNPITALLTSTQITQRCLAREDLRDARIPRFLETQIHQTRRLRRLVEDMLDSARIADGGFDVQCAPLDLRSVVQRVVEELRLTTTDHAIELHVPDQDVVVDGDRVRLEQVCYNLLLNALKYSPEGGPVEVTMQTEGNQAILCMQDHGIGIPASALPHLFERLYRAPNVTEYSVKGMGVGLYISQQIVQLHQGTITVESSEGQGSRFCVALPLLAQLPTTAFSANQTS